MFLLSKNLSFLVWKITCCSKCFWARSMIFLPWQQKTLKNSFCSKVNVHNQPSSWSKSCMAGRGRLSMLTAPCLDLQSLFGLHVHSSTHWLRPRQPPPPRILGGRYWSAKVDDIPLWPPVCTCSSKELEERQLRPWLPGSARKAAARQSRAGPGWPGSRRPSPPAGALSGSSTRSIQPLKSV